MDNQLQLFGAGPVLPDGFRYQANVIAPADEETLLEHIRTLPFREFEFQGYTGKRRVVSYGWKYDFNDRVLHKVDDIPPFLLSVRETAARFAGVDVNALQHVLVTEYSAGAA